MCWKYVTKYKTRPSFLKCKNKHSEHVIMNFYGIFGPYCVGLQGGALFLNYVRTNAYGLCVRVGACVRERVDVRVCIIN